MDRVARVFVGQVSAPKHSVTAILHGSEPVAVNAVASTPVYPFCHVCGVGIGVGIRSMADVIDGKLAGECMSCGGLRPVE